MKTKCRTIDELCGVPDGTFQKMIDENHKRWKIMIQHRRDCIKAKHEGKPMPKLPFEPELWMFA